MKKCITKNSSFKMICV